jgi:hypothetical protein
MFQLVHFLSRGGSVQLIYPLLPRTMLQQSKRQQADVECLALVASFVDSQGWVLFLLGMRVVDSNVWRRMQLYHR